MRKLQISTYSGYKHNRYDGFCCSWGVLIAAGGKPTADCFVTCNCTHESDCEGDCPACQDCNCDGQIDISRFFKSGVEPERFHETVLENLDAIPEIDDGESYTEIQNAGGYTYGYTFYRSGNSVTVKLPTGEVCDCDFI